MPDQFVQGMKGAALAVDLRRRLHLDCAVLPLRHCRHVAPARPGVENRLARALAAGAASRQRGVKCRQRNGQMRRAPGVPAIIPPTVGVILTAALVGGGSNRLHQITQPAPKTSGEQLNTVKLGEGAS